MSNIFLCRFMYIYCNTLLYIYCPHCPISSYIGLYCSSCSFIFLHCPMFVGYIVLHCPILPYIVLQYGFHHRVLTGTEEAKITNLSILFRQELSSRECKMIQIFILYVPTFNRVQGGFSAPKLRKQHPFKGFVPWG